MIECKNCRYKGCALCGTGHKIHAATCENYTPATNADKIRAMSNEELAMWMATVPMSYEEVCPNPMPNKCNGGDVEACKQCWLDWLTQEVKEGET